MYEASSVLTFFGLCYTLCTMLRWRCTHCSYIWCLAAWKADG